MERDTPVPHRGHVGVRPKAASLPELARRLPGAVHSPWFLFLGIGVALVGVYVWLPRDAPASALYDSIGLAAGIAVLVGVRRNKPRRALPWYLLAIGQFLFAAGDIVWDLYEYVFNSSPSPSLADVLYLGGYPVLVVALSLFLRERMPGGDRRTFIDSMIVATGVGVVVWTFLADPYVGDSSLDPLERVVAVIYPLADIVLLGALIRLLAAPGARPFAFRLLAVSLVLNLVADTVYAASTLGAISVDSVVTDAAYLIAYVAWGASALHPSMAAVAVPAADRETRLGPVRLALLAGSCLLAPSVLLAASAFGIVVPVPVLAIGSGATFLLVVARMTGLVRDLGVTLGEREILADQLRHRAFHDPLTGLANRALLADRVEHALRRRSGGAASVALVLLDLDDFKSVNDSLGHAAGDELLVELAGRIGRSTRSGDTAARLGGDEFALLLEDLDDDLTALRVTERMLAELSRPVAIGGRELFVRASTGIVFAGPERCSGEELLRDADVAMYLAKRRGDGRVAVFEPLMHQALLDRVALQEDLRQSLAHDDFSLRYQPIVALDTGQTVGFEALLRWDHPRLGALGAEAFIQVAEATGLIVDLGRWALETACAEAQSWHTALRARGATQLPILNVNMSVRQLHEPGFAATVTAALDATGFEPSALVLEITESVLLDAVEGVLDRLQELRALGVRLALDDFGTGYSSLSYLHRFPVDFIKIDRAFIATLADGPEPAGLVRAITQLAATLHAETIAEGIEHETDVTALQAMGCRFGQGFHFAVPLTEEEVDARLGIAAESQASGDEMAAPRRRWIALEGAT